ncbi:hypothetical protein IFM89_023029 [Coptis chinensis]|uniref:Uncharacterized protein n=1 Tax=Coptis chinensis TaxID=261450 RepID=A0A835IF24_9MAGN|nr:hypothetical protein IFM89_023029 [Coptis chinensis]
MVLSYNQFFFGVDLAAELDVGKGIVATVVSIKNSKGESALHLGAAEGNGDICKYLINDLKLDVDIKDNKGATLGGHLGITKHLLKKGANPNSVDDSGFTPLHNAAEIDTTLSRFYILANL